MSSQADPDQIVEAAIHSIRAHLQELNPAEPDGLVFRVNALHLELNNLTDLAVDAQRRYGMSWTQIGQQLGTTKQAAQQRFGSSRSDANAGGVAD